MAWNVKNEIPTGRMKFSSGRSAAMPRPSRALSALSTKNPAYLKNPSEARLAPTATLTIARRAPGCCRRSSQVAAAWFTTVEAAIRPTKRMSQ